MLILENIGLRYPLPGQSSHSLQATLYQKVGGTIGLTGKASSQLVTYVEALKDINLTVTDGQRLGIIGHNGAGKTTLMRVITGVYPPTSGKIHAHGKISALTDFTLGMDQEQSGLKNIVFRLVFMGFTFKQAKQAVDEIVEFSELGEFIHLPVRTYSTGMFLRLAFAISTHFTPDILVLDEVIGAGDAAFQAKAQKRVRDLLDKSRIVIMSSHDLAAIKAFCSTAIVMKSGQIIAQGTPENMIQDYLGVQVPTNERH
jgi:lipopolysaccharide transport system ATP-binding protein